MKKTISFLLLSTLCNNIIFCPAYFERGRPHGFAFYYEPSTTTRISQKETPPISQNETPPISQNETPPISQNETPPLENTQNKKIKVSCFC